MRSRRLVLTAAGMVIVAWGTGCTSTSVHTIDLSVSEVDRVAVEAAFMSGVIFDKVDRTGDGVVLHQPPGWYEGDGTLTYIWRSQGPGKTNLTIKTYRGVNANHNLIVQYINELAEQRSPKMSDSTRRMP